MSSIIQGYEYDIFISYRQKDNKHDGWVTEFVNNLKGELESTLKDEVTVYFDINPTDGLLDTHDVNESLKEKLKCLIFIPIISRTYCDPKSFAWENEFKAFIEQASHDQFGLKVKLPGGNVANRILPIQIHDLDKEDRKLVENELGGFIRGIEFIYREPGVNKPLIYGDDEKKNLNNTKYNIQINKVANSIKEIISALKTYNQQKIEIPKEKNKKRPDTKKKLMPGIITVSLLLLALMVIGYFIVPKLFNHPELPEKSIAVLPFVDLSPGHDKEYFTDGMLEEILNNLAKIGDLKVTSRTSSMQYKGETTKSVKEIAAELGVSNILEGSVRLYKNTVRITVQLIRAGTDEHLWSEDYDRDFSDIFFIQSEVAEEVAKALKAEISPEVQRIIDLKPTSNPEAYNLYLQAQDMNFFNASERIKVLELLRKAIELDPDFSMAYASLGFQLTVDATYLASTQRLNMKEMWEKAKPYFIKALQLNPDNGQAHILYAWSLLWFEWNFKAAAREYKEGCRIFPNYSWTDYHLALGEYEKAYEGAIKDINFDAKNEVSWTGIIISSYFANHDPDGEIKKALTTPVIRDNIQVRSESARIYMYLKEYDEAIALVNQLFKDFPEVKSARLEAVQAISYFKTNRTDETRKIIAKLRHRSEQNEGGSPSFYLAMIYAQTGETETAFDWLEKSFSDHEVEMYWLKVEPPFEPLRSDPRFQAILDKAGFSK